MCKGAFYYLCVYVCMYIYMHFVLYPSLRNILTNAANEPSFQVLLARALSLKQAPTRDWSQTHCLRWTRLPCGRAEQSYSCSQLATPALLPEPVASSYSTLELLATSSPWDPCASRAWIASHRTGRHHALPQGPVPGRVFADGPRATRARLVSLESTRHSALLPTTGRWRQQRRHSRSRWQHPGRACRATGQRFVH